MSHLSRISRVLLCCLGLLAVLVVPASADDAFGAEGAAPEQTPFVATVDLDGVDDFLVAVEPVDAEQPLELRAVSIRHGGPKGDRDAAPARRHTTLHLEPGGRAVLGTESVAGFDRLFLIGDRAFEAVVEDTATGRELRIVGDAGVQAPRKSSQLQCDGLWNLSCYSPSTCTYVSGFLPGRVEPGGQLYWNLHTPIGFYETEANGCGATWFNVQPNGCPTTVLNCYGEWYSIQTQVQSPPQGPDLVIRNLSVSPTSVLSGGPVTVSYDVVNEGDQAVSGTYRERVTLQGGAGAQELAVTLPRTQTLGAGASISESLLVAIPASAGGYSIGVEADALGEIAEGDETNNLALASITVTAVAGGQVTIDGLTYRPQSVDPWHVSLHDCPRGVPCSRSVQLRNTGTATAALSVQDSTSGATTLSTSCGTSLAVGASCSITIQHTLAPWATQANGGSVLVFSTTTVPSQGVFPICIAANDTACR